MGPARFHVDGWIRWCQSCAAEVKLRRDCKWSYYWRIWQHHCPEWTRNGMGDVVLRKVK